MSKHICTRWAFDLSNWKSPSLSQLLHAMAAVQLEERQRLMKFVFLEDFLSSLVGRLLMRKYVSQISGEDYYKVHFERDERGKPYWTSAAQQPGLLSFNVSHQADMVVLGGVSLASDCNSNNAVETDYGVGVDVMKVEYTGGKPLEEFFRLMHNKFANNEWAYICRPQHNQRKQLQAFMRHWSLKEAYVKELGVGITIDLQKISFSVHAECELNTKSALTNTTLCCDGKLMQNWKFEEHLLQNDEGDYCAAFAYKNCQPEVGSFQFLTLGDLIVEKSINMDNAELLAYCENVLKKQRKSW